MKIPELKDKLQNDRLFKGIAYGVLGTLALEFIILLLIFALRALPDSSERGIRREERRELRKERRAVRAAGPQEAVAEAVAPPDTAAVEEIYEYNIPISEYRKTEGTIRRGEFFSTLMTRLGASQSDIYALDAKSKGVFDMRQIICSGRAGYPGLCGLREGQYFLCRLFPQGQSFRAGIREEYHQCDGLCGG